MDVRERQQRFAAGARAHAERLVTAAAMSRAGVAAADEAGEAAPAGEDQVEQVPELLSVGIDALTAWTEPASMYKTDPTDPADSFLGHSTQIDNHQPALR